MFRALKWRFWPLYFFLLSGFRFEPALTLTGPDVLRVAGLQAVPAFAAGSD